MFNILNALVFVGGYIYYNTNYGQGVWTRTAIAVGDANWYEQLSPLHIYLVV